MAWPVKQAVPAQDFQWIARSKCVAPAPAIAVSEKQEGLGCLSFCRRRVAQIRLLCLMMTAIERCRTWLQPYRPNLRTPTLSFPIEGRIHKVPLAQVEQTAFQNPKVGKNVTLNQTIAAELAY